MKQQKNDCLLKDYVNFYSGGTIEYRKIDGEKRKTLVIPYDEMKNILNIIQLKKEIIFIE